MKNKFLHITVTDMGTYSRYIIINIFIQPSISHSLDMKMVWHNSGGKVRDLHFKENTNKAEKTVYNKTIPVYLQQQTCRKAYLVCP
jgi:hypothetical protein